MNGVTTDLSSCSSDVQLGHSRQASAMRSATDYLAYYYSCEMMGLEGGGRKGQSASCGLTSTCLRYGRGGHSLCRKVNGLTCIQ